MNCSTFSDCDFEDGSSAFQLAGPETGKDREQQKWLFLFAGNSDRLELLPAGDDVS